MTRPDDIPQRVWDEAERVAKEATRQAMQDPLMPYYITVAPHIARAILSAEQREREACALVAASLADDWAEASKRLSDAGMISDGTIGAASLGARDIAAAIRNRGTDND